MRGTWQTTESGGSGSAGAVVVLLIFIVIGLRAMWPEIVKTVEVIAWTAAGVTGAALAVTVGVLVARVIARFRRARRARTVTPARPVLRIVRESEVRPLPQSRRAIEAARSRPSNAWPLPGWWEDIRTRIGSDDDDARPR